MRSHPEKLVLVATLVATPLFMSASESSQPANVPIPIHELNFSPSFSGHPTDLTLVAKPPAAQKTLPTFAPLPGGTLRLPGSPQSPGLTPLSTGVISATPASSGPTAAPLDDRELDRELAAAKEKLELAKARLEKLQAERKALESR
jgi:hypothetical protein